MLLSHFSNLSRVVSLTFDLLEFDDLRDLMEKHGFHEASGIVKEPVVPGPEGFDTYWYRDSDELFVQVSWNGGKVDPPAQYKVAYGKYPESPDLVIGFKEGYLTLSMVKDLLQPIL